MSLHYACKLNNLSKVKKLIDDGYDVNLLDTDGWSPLHYACGNVECMKILIDAGADIHRRSSDGWTLLHASVCGKFPGDGGFVEAIKLLLDYGIDTSIKTNDGYTALMVAEELAEVRIIELLKNYEDFLEIKEPDN